MNTNSFHCPQCRQMKLFQQQTMNHTPHILASVFLCGLWLPVWILSAIFDNQPWRCSFCGYSAAPKYLYDPTLWQREQAQLRQKAFEREQNPSKSPFDPVNYWILDNPFPTAGIGLALLLAGFVVIGTLRTAGKRDVSTKTPVSEKQWSEAEKLSKRQKFAAGLDGAGGYSASLSGANQDILVITQLMISREKGETLTNETWNQMPYERVGFKTVIFQSSPKPKAERWTYDIATRQFK